jgi:hypothetical protein
VSETEQQGAASNTSRWLWGGLLPLLVIAGLGLGLWLRPEPQVTRTAPLPDCELRRGPCTATLSPGETIRFGIEPRDIPCLKPLQLSVRLTGLKADEVEIDFHGVDMDMGFNRLRLQEQPDGGFAGKGMLPVCVRESMEWEARVYVRNEDGQVMAPFRFVTFKH